MDPGSAFPFKLTLVWFVKSGKLLNLGGPGGVVSVELMGLVLLPISETKAAKLPKMGKPTKNISAAAAIVSKIKNTAFLVFLRSSTDTSLE